MCATSKAGTGAAAPDTLRHYPIPPSVFQSLCIDFVHICDRDDATPDPDHVLVVVCRHSGYTVGIPVRKKGLTAEGTAKLLYDRVGSFMGCPNEIFSDQDVVLNTKFFSAFCEHFGVRQRMSTPYTPKHNGRAERAVQAVVESLRIFSNLVGRGADWVDYLPRAIWRVNSCPGPTGFSPHRVVFGRDLVGWGDRLPLPPTREVPSVQEFCDKVADLDKQVADRLAEQHKRLDDKFLAKRPLVVFREGQRVWVKVRSEEAEKLSGRWTGPHEVLERKGTGRYVVGMEGESKELPLHRLKPCYDAVEEGDPVDIPLHVYKRRPKRKGGEEERTWVVETILGRRKRQGREEWLVKWQDYGPEHNSWEPLASFLHGVNRDWVRYNAEHGIAPTVTPGSLCPPQQFFPPSRP